MKALPLNHFLFQFNPSNEITIDMPSGTTNVMKLKSLKKQNNYALLSLCGIDDRETAMKYTGAILSVDKGLLPPLQNEVYSYDQIIGLTVCTRKGNVIGTISDIFETGSNDVYVVDALHREYLLPAIRDVIKNIDIEKGIIYIDILDGLLE